MAINIYYFSAGSIIILLLLIISNRLRDDSFLKKVMLTFIGIVLLLFISYVIIDAVKFLISQLNDEEERLDTLFFLLVVIIVIFLFLFLVYDSNKKNEEKTIINDDKHLFNKKREFLKEILETINFKIDEDLKKNLEGGNIEDANKQVSQKISSINKLIETVKGDDTNSLRGTDISSIRDFYESTTSRIENEVKRLSKISYINLGIGVTVSLFAIGFLINITLEHKIELMELIPRATISLLIEAFAFFFFNQYRKQQEDVKYWNNEKTYLDLKIFAFSTAIDNKEVGTSEYMRTLISDFINAEKGQKNSDNKQKESVEEKSKDNSEDKKLIVDIMDKAKEIASLVIKK